MGVNLYFFCLALVKLSILTFFARINPTRNFRAIVYAVGAFVTAHSLGSIVANIVSGARVLASTDIQKGQAPTPGAAFAISTGSFNILSDVMLLLLPIPLLWKVLLPLRTKIGITGILMTGSL